MVFEERVLDARRLLWTALCLALLTVSAFQGTRGLFDSTEGRYAECAREMVVSGDYLRPTLDFAPHWTKPPLTYWAIAGGLRLFGINEWGARAYLVPVFVLTVFAVYRLGRGLWDRSTGALAALVYATLWGPAAAAHTVNTDSLLVLWEAWAVVFFWDGYRTGRGASRVLMWFFFSLAFLTKGPPALVPLAALLAFSFRAEDRRLCRAGLLHPGGWAVFLLTALSWYVYCVVHYRGLLRYWLGDEVVGRIFTGKFGRHPHWYEAFTVYWPFLLGGACPWLLVLVWKARREVKEALASGFQGSVRSKASRLAAFLRELPDPWRFLLIAIAVPLLVFSVSRSRLPLYVLFLFVPVTCMTARALSELVRSGRLSVRKILGIAVVSALVLVIGKSVYARWPSRRDMGAVARSVERIVPPKSGRKVFLVSSRPHYALRFYFDGALERFHPSDTLQEPGFRRFSELPGACRDALAQGSSVAVLVETKGADPVVENLRRAGLGVTTRPVNGYWTVLNCAETAPPGATAP